MRGETLGGEVKANIILDHERRGMGARKIAAKLGLDQSTVGRVFQRHGEALRGGGGFVVSGLKKVEIPDEELQGDEQKIAFYREEAQRCKAAAMEIERRLGLSRGERNALMAREIASLVESHELREIAPRQKMSREDFLDYLEKLQKIQFSH